MQSGYFLKKVDYFNNNNILMFSVSVAFNPDDIEFLHPVSIVIEDLNLNESYFFNNQSHEFHSINSVFDPYDNCYTLSKHDFSVISSLFSDYLDLTIVDDEEINCDCCGSYFNYTVRFKSKKFNTEVSFYYDDHFGNSYMPTGHNILDFIMNGVCQDDWSD